MISRTPSEIEALKERIEETPVEGGDDILDMIQNGYTIDDYNEDHQFYNALMSVHLWLEGELPSIDSLWNFEVR